MAFKLCNRNFKIIKLEKLFCEGSKGIASRCFGRHNLSSESIVRGGDAIRSFVSPRENRRFVHVSFRVAYAKVVPYNLSDIGEGIVEVVIKEWLIKPGDTISQFDPICEVQSDKAAVTISSRYDGVVKKLHHQVDEIAKVGAPLIDIEIEDEAEDEGEPEKAEPKTDARVGEEPKVSRDKALATPAVRRLATENNVDLLKVKGSGRDGRILKDDIILYLDDVKRGDEPKAAPAPRPPPPPPPPASSSSPPPPPPRPKVAFDGLDRVEEIAGIKKAMVKSMATAWAVPHFSYCDEVNVDALHDMRGDFKKLGEAKGVKMTFMPFFIKAASLALTKYPVLNSHVDDKCEKITLKYSHNIGVAIDSPHGLVVPNIKNVQDLSVVEIARELNYLQELAAGGRLGLEHMANGTFTLSNIGNIGGTYMKPIIFPPQVIIGALGKIQVLPRFDDEKNVKEAHVFNVSWSADHRVIDGATVARFSNLWKLLLEHPKVLLGW